MYCTTVLNSKREDQSFCDLFKWDIGLMVYKNNFAHTITKLELHMNELHK